MTDTHFMLSDIGQGRDVQRIDPVLVGPGIDELLGISESKPSQAP